MDCPKCNKKVNTTDIFCQYCGNSLSDHSISTQGTVAVTSAKNRLKALLWIVAPVVLMVFILLLYAVATFVTAALEISDDSTLQNLFQIFLGFLGLIAVIAVPVGLFLGIRLILRKELLPASEFDPRSGKGSASVIPQEIKGWNWGAAAFCTVWGIYHSVWISLLAFVPLVNYIWWIVLGIKGNEWAWSSVPWRSVEEFKQAQNKWRPWALAMFALSIVSIVLVVVLSYGQE